MAWRRPRWCPDPASCGHSGYNMHNDTVHSSSGHSDWVTPVVPSACHPDWETLVVPSACYSAMPVVQSVTRSRVVGPRPALRRGPSSARKGLTPSFGKTSISRYQIEEDASLRRHRPRKRAWSDFSNHATRLDPKVERCVAIRDAFELALSLGYSKPGVGGSDPYAMYGAPHTAEAVA